jgi:hypothetical protein
MGLLDKNVDLVIDGQRIRSYNNLKNWKTRPNAKDGFLRFDKGDGKDSSQKLTDCCEGIIAL